MKDLAPLAEPVWLVVDDVHLLGPDQALRQLELLIMRAPDALRFVLCTRHDLRLGLHRLRLAGELAEIRAGDLRFCVAEARELFAGAGVELADPAVAMLHERTEGWAAGLRLAALSLAGHPDPGRFAAEFSGSERTVAEYLLDEVLDRQAEAVRRLLLRTSVLERVNGELADLLAGGYRPAGSRCCWTSRRPTRSWCRWTRARSWFRYHQLFAGLLALEAAAHRAGGGHRAARVAARGSRSTGTRWRRSATPRPHRTGGWPPACSPGTGPACIWAGRPRRCTRSWPGSRRGPRRRMLSWRRWRRPMSWPGIAGGRGAVSEVAARGAASVPAARRGQAQVLLGIIRLLVARHRGNPPAVAEEARRLQATAEAPEAAPGLGEELRALALISLGSAEYGAAQFEDAARTWSRARRWPAGSGGPGVHRPGVPGAGRTRAVILAGGGARQAGGRAGRTARLDRGGRRKRLHGTRRRADPAGAAR